jgi:hypothetical protein
MNPSIGTKFFLLALLSGQICFSQKTAAPEINIGEIRFAMISPSVTDTGMQTIYFKKGMGAFTMISPGDSSGFHSIFDFEKDSVFHILKGPTPARIIALKLSESLAQSKQETQMKVKLTEKTKQILGYECTQFKANSVGNGRKMKLEGWVTNKIVTKVRPIMDESLMSIGFPLEMTLSIPSVSSKPTMIFQAVSINPSADPAAFKIPATN